MPNLPTEEVFTTPDPERIEGVVARDQAARPRRLDHPRAARSSSRGGRRRADRRRRGRRRPARLRRAGRRAPRASARSRWSTATGASARWTPSSTTRCSTRTPPATSRWARPTTSRAGRRGRSTRLNDARDPRRLHDRRAAASRSTASPPTATPCRCCAAAPGRSDRYPARRPPGADPGEVPEWLNGHDWKSCVR